MLRRRLILVPNPAQLVLPTHKQFLAACALRRDHCLIDPFLEVSHSLCKRVIHRDLADNLARLVNGKIVAIFINDKSRHHFTNGLDLAVFHIDILIHCEWHFLQPLTGHFDIDYKFLTHGILYGKADNAFTLMWVANKAAVLL